MDRMLIVDGSNLLFQMFYGMPSRIIGKNGKAIQGTVGFIGALLRIIRMTDPTHVAVLFDGEHNNPRKQLDCEYKSNRPDYSQMPEEETPFSQLCDIYSALDVMGICHRETIDCETDDLIAGYAMKYGKEHSMIISSFDSDFFQLITDNVKILRYRGDNTVICDTEYVRRKLGIEPAQYAEFKSMTGDSSDNIKGIYKVGPKTAAELLNRFGSIEKIFEKLDEIRKPSVRRAISESKDRLKLNYELIKLGKEAALPFDKKEMEYIRSSLTTGLVLKEIGLR